jgi:hypothetical protein
MPAMRHRGWPGFFQAPSILKFRIICYDTIYPNPDKPELNIEYSIDNIQLWQDGDDIPISFAWQEMHKNTT